MNLKSNTVELQKGEVISVIIVNTFGDGYEAYGTSSVKEGKVAFTMYKIQ